ncbi:MAG: hypothetical protein E7231_02735 [Cellulosilyticum sp.]|nr:hypothetical protein [Cellulosilyticum sp.]
MNSINELRWDELNHSYQPSEFSFRTTDEVESIDELIDQEDAIEAIRRGLQIDSKGYNLFICGVNNQKMESAIIEEVKKAALEKTCPLAVGYMYNFDIPEEPVVVTLSSEDAISLKSDLQELRAFFLIDIPILLESDEVKTKQKILIKEFEQLSEKYLKDLENQAIGFNIQVKQTEEGEIRFAPLNEKGENLSKEIFLNLTTEKQEEIMEHISALQEYADELSEILEEKEAYYTKLYSEIGQEIILREVGKNIKQLTERYKDYPYLLHYFNGIAEEILAHIELLSSMTDEVSEAGELELKTKEAQRLLISQEIERLVKKYDINLLCVPKETHAPIVLDTEYGQLGLMGNILLDVENNTVHTDFLHIRPGLINKANGGYLILHIQELVEKKNSWNQLKEVLRTGYMSIEGNEEIGIALAKQLKPKPIPIALKVILIGNHEIYELLKEYDEEFTKFFKRHIVFNDELLVDASKVEQIAGIIKQLSKEESIKPVTTEGLLKLLEYGHRKMEHPGKICSDLEELMDILREAQLYADEYIGKNEIVKCLEERERYERKVKERLDESLEDGTYLIDTTGAKIGQINGLAVYSIGELSFGRPIRITATTYRGKRGIVDIENEAKLSGAIHTKGIHIITGFLGNQFAQEMPLSLNCNLCFEQSYVGVDGDSASSAELYTILSSLAEIPIRQNIAVTGSVNQFGEIQPVGGINEKIEGFFQICKRRGLRGEEGVMIPRTNIKELMLIPEVLEAVKNKTFHIYAISDIWEGARIMMQEEKEVIKKRIQEKLIRFNQ